MSVDNNTYFKMGATVAISELFGLGRFGEDERAAEEARSFLTSFGVRNMEDVANLGIRGPYLFDLKRIYGA